MEQQQQERNWTLEDIKGALMDDIKAMMQEELRQALAGLMPPAAPAATNPPAAIVAPAVNPPVVDAPPANNDNAGGQPLNAARNMPTIDMKFEDVENYMVEKAKKESLELAQDLESKQMQAVNQKMSKMEELMRGQGISYSFDFDNIQCMKGDELPDKFKMPQLQKFDGTGDPRIHMSQNATTMSTTKAPLSIVTKLFVLSLEGMDINWYHGLEKSIRAA